ncbi:polysaccharide deacetylase family protein [Tenacibaculum sp. IB213877]|uniref:polysaccharide deacetylase family protein n=1 Tax=Tenacibaculum sp. IB213877 TaxID=3097351 RepID=UPI002A598D7F|nr:polysaccharide deacetylase family protein [Tenacibaculum sp. IB213877]MDY0780094.1 polysaccharide deacetylase family protein [Tenacibaculum sp. IB213877]
MILVYTHKITPRVRYIFKHIFTRILLVDVDFTNKVEDFVAFNGPKISYTTVALGKEFFIKSTSLLFEQGISDVEINMGKWDKVPCFFEVGTKSSIPYDIFSASFYLITRYEEYLPHIKDKHSRFSAEQSLAYQNDFLEKPMIDVWAYKLRKTLKERFPEYEFKTRKYNYISTIDVDNAFAYKYKSFIRTIGGLLNDVYKLHILNIWDRLAVRFNFKKDPFDTFQELLKLKKEYNVKTIFFFLIGDYTSYDTNISASKDKFKLLIKDMVDYARVGLHPSYYTMQNLDLLKKEKERLEAITNMPMIRSRQHYLRLSLPYTYQKLIDLEIKEDYSMGYASHVGFRASTCTPFYFYDLDYEIQTPLRVFPFALMDTTLNDYMKLTPKQSLGKIRELMHEVKRVNGTFITLFHNESLSNYLRWKGWQRVYGSMLKMASNK